MNQPSSPPPSDAPSFIPPKWVGWLLALIPVFPPLYLAAFGCWKLLRSLPLTARRVLFFFAATQLVATIFTPQPLLSLGLATARTFLILAMISAGVYLRDSRNLRPLLWGQLIVFVTAWGYTLYTQGFAGVQARLGHPYYYIVSLGLVAVVALWIIIFWQGGKLWWRLPAGLLALGTFLAAGSRGPLLALLIGSGVGLFAQRHVISRQAQRVVGAVGGIALLCVLVGVTFPTALPKEIGHLFDQQLNHRDVIWREATNAWLAHSVGGVGPYQGGPYIPYLYQSGCQLTPTTERVGLSCPAALRSISSALLTAHNGWLHWLLEAGIIGTSGLLVVMAYAAWMLLTSTGFFEAAIFYGYLTMSLVDVVIAVPSQHFTELWWVIIGIIFLGERTQKVKNV